MRGSNAEQNARSSGPEVIASTAGLAVARDRVGRAADLRLRPPPLRSYAETDVECMRRRLSDNETECALHALGQDTFTDGAGWDDVAASRRE